MKFSLEIHLGNDAMSTPDELARKLHEIAADVARIEFVQTSKLGGAIRDDNGNSVGAWRIRPR